MNIEEKQLTEQEQQDIKFFASQQDRDRNLAIFKGRYYQRLALAADHIMEKKNNAYPLYLNGEKIVYYPKGDKLHFQTTTNTYEKNGLEYLIKNIL